MLRNALFFGKAGEIAADAAPKLPLASGDWELCP